MRSHNIREVSKNLIYFEVTFPNEMDPAQVTDWHRSIAAAMPPGTIFNRSEQSVVLEWWRNKTGFTHVIGVPWTHQELMGQLIGAVRGLHFKELKTHPAVEWTVAAEYGISDPNKKLDVKRLASQVNATLGAGIYEQNPTDEILSQLVIAPVGKVDANPTKPMWGLDQLFGATQEKSQDVAELREKLESPTFKAVLRIAVKSDTEAHAKHILKKITNSYERTDTASVYVKRRYLTSQSSVIDRIKRGATSFDIPAVLNSDEVTAFSAWPVTGVKQPGLTLGKTQWLPPTELIATEGIKFGMASASGYKRPIAVRPEDLMRHVLIQGPSGNGKTTAMTNMFQQAAEQGLGLTMLETKGDLFYRGLDAIPRERMDDVIVIDLSDQEYSVGLNLLQEGSVDHIINLFSEGATDQKLFNKVARNGFNTLRFIPNATVVDLIPLLDPSTDEEEEWQQYVISQISKNDPVQTFWREYMSKRPNDRKNYIAPILNRLWKFDSYEPMRRTLGQSESTFSLRNAMRDGKIVMIYAPFEIGNEPVSLFLSLMMMEINKINRQVREEKKQPSLVFVDEVQRLRYMSIPFAEMLSLWRADRTGLVMANQYMSQLAPDMQNAMTNVGTMIATRLDGPDARYWQQFMGKAITPDDLMNLEPYEALGRMAIPGGVSEPVTFHTYSPFKPHGHAAAIQRRSRELYARKSSEVDAETRKRRRAPSKPKRTRPSFGDMEVDE